MRILAGQYKGKKLFAGNDLSIRPTTNRIKESIFNVLQDFCKNKTVIDIFSGSGNLGIEALSRGANTVTFIDKEDSSIQVLKKNIHTLNIGSDKVVFVKNDAVRFCNRTKYSYDLILMDPPFDYPPLQELISIITKKQMLDTNGIMIVEHEITNPILHSNEHYRILNQKKYGRSLISFIIGEGDHG